MDCTSSSTTPATPGTTSSRRPPTSSGTPCWTSTSPARSGSCAAQPLISAAVKQERAAGISVCRKVVNVSSIAGLVGNPGQAGYAAAKAGVIGLTRTMAKEWGRYNVTTNTVAFGLIDTRLTEPTTADTTIDVAGRQIKVGVNPGLLQAAEQLIPLGRTGTPEEAAGAVYLLCTPESDYISGQTLVCAGGFQG
ncbi:SDR family oxidoreductase [Streptomyces sp. NPDC058745]|uniref:SDR family oxidoreductase n=1 Tax=Streptomyces sp. NPDC058745 TaxID=3346621 RepID=UPI0036C2EF3E